MSATRRHPAAALACVAGILGGLAISGPAAASPADAGVPSRVLVTAREYSLALSRPKVEAGPAIVQLYDYGEDPHDLKLQRQGSSRVFSLGEVAPGETGRLDLKLRRSSRYRLWCSLEGHAALGMTATLKTSRK